MPTQQFARNMPNKTYSSFNYHFTTISC